MELQGLNWAGLGVFKPSQRFMHTEVEVVDAGCG